MTQLVAIWFVILLSVCQQATADALDIDGDGQVKALSDGLLIIRDMFGFNGDSLIQGAISTECTYCTAEEIQDRLGSLNESGLQAGLKGLSLVANNGKKMLVLSVDVEGLTPYLAVAIPLDTEVGEKVIFARLRLDGAVYSIRYIEGRTKADLVYDESECGGQIETLLTVVRSSIYDTLGPTGLTDAYIFVAGTINLDPLALGGLRRFEFPDGTSSREDWNSEVGDIWVFGDTEEIYDRLPSPFRYRVMADRDCTNPTGEHDGTVKFAYKAGNFFELFPPPYKLVAN